MLKWGRKTLGEEVAKQSELEAAGGETVVKQGGQEVEGDGLAEKQV